jgi:hypothetical protein
MQTIVNDTDGASTQTTPMLQTTIDNAGSTSKQTTVNDTDGAATQMAVGNADDGQRRRQRSMMQTTTTQHFPPPLLTLH